MAGGLRDENLSHLSDWSVINWLRFMTRGEGKSFVLCWKLSVTPYKQYQREALEAAVGQAVHLSFPYGQ